MANGLTEDALSKRLNALSGGAPLPQAATMAIARRLLGPGMADRYGDVIGARPVGVQDIARDFAIGTISGDPFKADELKMRVAQGYREELRREEDQAIQREEAARQQVEGFFRLLSEGKKIPKDLRKDFFKENLPKVGVEPTSPMFLNLLTNYEKYGDIYDSLSDPEIQRLADDDPLAAVERMIAMGHDGTEAIKVAQTVQAMKRYRADTQHLIAQTKRIKGLTQDDPNARNRAAFISRMWGRTTTDRLGRKKLLSADDIADMADRFFPSVPGATPKVSPSEALGPTPSTPPGPVGIPQVGVAGGSLEEMTSTSSTPTTTGGETVTPTTAPAGIPQAAPPPAPADATAGKQKVRRITGTVTRVE